MKVWFFNFNDRLEDLEEIFSFRAAVCPRHVLPAEKSRANKLSCSASLFICISHLLYDTDLLHKQAGTRPGKSGTHPSHRQSWHGEPPQMISTGGNSAPFSLVMSPTCIISGKWCFVTLIGNGSISLAHTGTIPFRTAASGKPPMPSNKLPKVKGSTPSTSPPLLSIQNRLPEYLRRSPDAQGCRAARPAPFPLPCLR